MAKKEKKDAVLEESVNATKTAKKNKKTKKVKTREEKLRKKKTRLIVWTSIISALLVVFVTLGATTKIGSDGLLKKVQAITPIDWNEGERIMPLDKDGNPVVEGKTLPAVDENGCFTFKDVDNKLATRNFRVLQLTDIHIGAGAFSIKNDAWTIQTVEDLVKKARPDLVVVTGDIAYPVFFQSATLNNKKEAKVFATMMENLGVYWTFEFGNHDTELYSSYTREDIGEFYSNTEMFPHCLFNNEKKKYIDENNQEQEVFGQGNFAITVVANDDTLVHTLYMVDSNAYMDDDPLGAKWHYDRIHDDQIAWYEQTAQKIATKYGDVTNAKSTMYFHIPIKEFNEVFFEYNKTQNRDKESMKGLNPTDVNPKIGELKEIALDENLSAEEKANKITKFKLCNGIVGEWGKGALGTEEPSRIYDALVSNGTTGVFCGHDHMNNSSFWVQKGNNPNDKIGLKLTYGMSVDYLAYPGIYKKTAQRGGRMIEINKVGQILNNENIVDEEIGFDQQFGFTTYNVPYWNDLAKA